MVVEGVPPLVARQSGERLRSALDEVAAEGTRARELAREGLHAGRVVLWPHHLALGSLRATGVGGGGLGVVHALARALAVHLADPRALQQLRGRPAGVRLHVQRGGEHLVQRLGRGAEAPAESALEEVFLGGQRGPDRLLRLGARAHGAVPADHAAQLPQAEQQLEQHNACRPHVAARRVVAGGAQDQGLRRHEGQCASEGVAALAGWDGRPEVDHLHRRARRINRNVLRLDVAVGDAAVMAVLDGAEYLVRHVPGRRRAHAPADELQMPAQIRTPCHLHPDEDVTRAMDYAEEGNDVLVVQSG
mmetsp:Transcript_47395/g.144221  ORF Transcript_47395/g.144221 Transcript_47395/m.144221 type:complete len:304 (+) Transcript_47395:436-1347(+)